MSNSSTHGAVTTGAIRVLFALCLVFAFGAQAADTDVVITEIMQNPAALGDTDGEWFELHNTGTTAVDLDGWTISDLGSDSFTISGSTVIPADGYAVLARNATAMAAEGVTVLYEYTGMFLGNSDDEIILTNASSVEIDRVEYDGGVDWPDPTGASMMWDEETGDNNVGTSWAEAGAEHAFGSGDYGTPGESNGEPSLQTPDVEDVYNRPLLPEPGETVSVYATLTDVDGTVVSGTVYYQVNGGGFTTAAMSVDSGDLWVGTIPAATNGDVIDYYVEATDNDAQTETNPYDAPVGFYSYTVAPEVITPIATVHADSAGYAGETIMVQGQVFIPGNYQGDGTSVSAYIQDSSGRGLNVYGYVRSTGMDLLNDTGNIVKVTGRVYYYYSTLEIENFEVELVSSGNPVLTPSVQTTGNAAATTNEGTYTATSGPITAIATTGGSNPAYNFTINDGSGDVVVRIDEDVIAGMDTWLLGDNLDAAGAGGAYSGQGQIIVGLTSDITNNGQGPDTDPPLLTGAALSADTEVTLQFNESIDPTTGNTAANYEVYETATPANTITVTGAVVQTDDTQVILTLAASASGISHTVRINNVEDLAGNPIATDTTMEIFEPGAAEIVINEIMQNPLVLLDAEGEWFEIYNAGPDAVDINGWTIADNDYDSHVIDNGGPLVIASGAYMVLGVNATSMAAEGVTLDYQYSGISLGNSADELILLDATLAEIDRVEWDNGATFPDPVGASMQWDGTGDNADGTNWGDTGPVFGSGDRGTPGGVNDLESPVPGLLVETSLRANHPNPFNPMTAFNFSLKADDHVKLQVYDVRGHLVRTIVDTDLTAGSYDGTYRWDGRGDDGRLVNSGTYFYRLSTGSGYAEARKMTLLK